MDTNIEIGENIKRLRTSHGYTQDDLARIMNVSSKYISALERGARHPGPKTMRLLCEAFGVTEDEIRFVALTDTHRLLWKLYQTVSEDEALELYVQGRKFLKAAREH